MNDTGIHSNCAVCSKHNLHLDHSVCPDCLNKAAQALFNTADNQRHTLPDQYNRAVIADMLQYCAARDMRQSLDRADNDTFYTVNRRRTYPVFPSGKGYPRSRSRRSTLKHNRAMWYTTKKTVNRYDFHNVNHLLFDLRTNWRMILVYPGWYNLSHFDTTHSYADWSRDRRARLHRILELCQKHKLHEKFEYYLSLSNEMYLHTT